MTAFLLDVNVLLALSLPRHQHHGAASRWFAEDVDWATTPTTETAYLRLMTNPKVVGYDIPGAEVLDALTRMRAVRGHRFLSDDSSLNEPQIDTDWLGGSKQVTDFHLLNLAAVNDLQMATFDASLARAVAPADRRHLFVLAD